MKNLNVTARHIDTINFACMEKLAARIDNLVGSICDMEEFFYDTPEYVREIMTAKGTKKHIKKMREELARLEAEFNRLSACMEKRKEMRPCPWA